VKDPTTGQDVPAGHRVQKFTFAGTRPAQ
jgi:hypothetical protein